MKLLEEIRSSTKKPKELLVYLSKQIQKDKAWLADYDKCLKEANPVERGILVECLEYVSHDKPETVEPYIEIIIPYLQDPAPRVKWEAARIIANLSKKYPEKTQKASELLLLNTKDKGTVVRWSAAYALGEILKYDIGARKKLLPEIEKLLKREANNGVKNVYLKALKAIKVQ